MRNRIFGAIGVIWGALILINGFLSSASEADSAAYKNGQTGALVFGAVLLVLGLYYSFKKPKPKK